MVGCALLFRKKVVFNNEPLLDYKYDCWFVLCWQNFLEKAIFQQSSVIRLLI